jgi:hypothetical protein
VYDVVALICRRLADTCLHVFTSADRPRNLQNSAGKRRVLRAAEAMRRPALIGGSIGKAVYDRDTMPSSTYWMTEAAA